MSRSPGERAGLSSEQVLDAALAVLRRDGLGGLSMRRVASALGVAPNALYSHVPTKDALLDGVIDRVLGEVAVPERGGWRARVEALMRDSRRVLLEHPDLIPHVLARQTTGPNALRLGEATLEQLARGGVPGERGVRALQVLLIHTIGAAAFEAPRRAEPDPAARTARARAAATALDPATHPRTTESADALAAHPGDEVFTSGLRWILDGLTAEQRR
jgi:TetR/AcrR family transcriptional regulator, tetracycline repressor protein